MRKLKYHLLLLFLISCSVVRADVDSTYSDVQEHETLSYRAMHAKSAQEIEQLVKDGIITTYNAYCSTYDNMITLYRSPVLRAAKGFAERIIYQLSLLAIKLSSKDKLKFWDASTPEIKTIIASFCLRHGSGVGDLNQYIENKIQLKKMFGPTCFSENSILEEEAGSSESHLSSPHPTDINSNSEAIMFEQWPALHSAIARRQFDIAAQILLQDNQQAHLLTPFKNNSHGEFNMESDQVAIEKVMQEIKSPYHLGYSALELAILYDSPALVAQILECGADVNLKHPMITFVNEDLPYRLNPKFDIQIVTPLFFAIQQQNSQIAQLLINAGANMEHVLLDVRAEFHSLLVGTPYGLEDWGSYWSIHYDIWGSVIGLNDSIKLSQIESIIPFVKKKRKKH